MRDLTALNRIFAGVVAVVVATAVCDVAHAQNGEPSTPTLSYDLDFSTDLNLLLNPNDPVAQHFAMWKTPTQLASLRSAPMIRLTNPASSTMPLTNLRIALADPNYLFDSFAVLEQPNNAGASLRSHTDVTFGGDMDSHLEWAFPSGLLPGDSFTFQVRLHRLSGTGLADYENVLWDKSLAQSTPSRTDNAEVTVSFSDMGGEGQSTFTLPSVRLFEYPLANANFPMDELGASGYINVLEGGDYDVIAGITHFHQAAGPVIPEPSSFALVGAAALTLTGYGWRRRRRAA